MFSLSRSWLSTHSTELEKKPPHISGFSFVSGDKSHLQQSEPGLLSKTKEKGADKSVMSAVTTSKPSHRACTSGPASGPGRSFVQPTAQLTLFTAHKGSQIMRTFSIFVFKRPGLPLSPDTLLLCEETVITKITFILNLRVSGFEQSYSKISY